MTDRLLEKILKMLIGIWWMLFALVLFEFASVIRSL